MSRSLVPGGAAAQARQFDARHGPHDEIRHQKVNGTVIVFALLQGFGSVADLKTV